MTRSAFAFRVANRALYALVAATLLTAAYPASYGPASYLLGRGWLAGPLMIYSPFLRALKSWPEAERLYYRYSICCYELGRDHSGRMPPRDNW